MIHQHGYAVIRSGINNFALSVCCSQSGCLRPNSVSCIVVDREWLLPVLFFTRCD